MQLLGTTNMWVNTVNLSLTGVKNYITAILMCKNQDFYYSSMIGFSIDNYQHSSHSPVC